jgi:sugar phosphate isomerase/epimerase
MSSKFQFSAITGSLGKTADRFVTSGYNNDTGLAEKLERLSKVKSLKAIELCYDGQNEESNETKVKELLGKYNLKVSTVIPPLSADRKYKFGSFTAKDKAIREEAIAMTKKTMDYAVKMNCDIINIWQGQDGYDYAFQVDYTKQWDYMIEAIQECADYNPKVKIALEPKPKEPRTHCIVDTVSSALLMAIDSKRDNVGLSIDVGHVFPVKQSPAQTVELAAKHQKLFNMHINDNYGDWDDDLIVGTVRTVEFIELFFALRKVNYDGYIAVDIFPFRDDTLRAAEESLRYMEKFNEQVDIIGYENLAKCLESADVTKTIQLIREKIYK